MPTVFTNRKRAGSDCQIEPSLVAFESTNIILIYMFGFTNARISPPNILSAYALNERESLHVALRTATEDVQLLWGESRVAGLRRPTIAKLKMPLARGLHSRHSAVGLV